MSVRFDVLLVDWDDFRDRLVRDGEWETIDEHPNEPLTWGAWSAAGEFVWIFEAMEKTWQTESKLRLAQIVDALFWSWRGKKRKPQVMELEIDPSTLDGIETALSPTTVKELAAAAASVLMSECEKFFPSATAKAGTGRFETFAEYRQYAEEWFHLLRRAADAGKGVVLVAVG